MSAYSSPHRQRGFTPTELSVYGIIVIVVVFVLYSIFKGPRYPGVAINGASNQKQIALAMLQYAQDYDDTFPPVVGYVRSGSDVVMQSWGPDRKLPDGRTVPGILEPYAKSNLLFLDPAADKSDRKNRVLEYMYNDLLAGQKKTTLADASATVLAVDAENRFENAGHALTPTFGPFAAVSNSRGGCDAGQGASIRSARLRHSGGANFAFADGHVKWFESGNDDLVYFPPRDSASVSSLDFESKKRIGPQPGTEMLFAGRHYKATFHIR